MARGSRRATSAPGKRERFYQDGMRGLARRAFRCLGGTGDETGRAWLLTFLANGGSLVIVSGSGGPRYSCKLTDWWFLNGGAGVLKAW